MKDEIQERFLQILEEKKMGKKEFSIAYDIPYQTVVSWTNGMRKPNINTLQEKAGINPKWMLTGIGNKYIDNTNSITNDKPKVNTVSPNELCLKENIENYTISELKSILEWYEKNINIIRKIIQATEVNNVEGAF